MLGWATWLVCRLCLYFTDFLANYYSTTILGSCNPLQGMDPSPDSQFVSNPHLKLLDDDMLFHIGIKAGDHQKLRNLFGDVKVSFLVTASFNYMLTVQVTVSFFAAINLSNRPHREHKFTLTGSIF